MEANRCYKNCYISAYSSILETQSDWILSVPDALERIKAGASKKLIDTIRGVDDHNHRTALKRKLPAMTWAGIYPERKKLHKASGLACMDFDKVKDPEGVKASLMASKYVYASWLSPSGNGVKALIPIPEGKYNLRYRALIKHFNWLNPDTATSDMNRLTYESYDPELLLNPSALIFEKMENPRKAPKTIEGGGELIRIYAWWRKRNDFIPGNRNNSLFVLAKAMNDHGVPMYDTMNIAKELNSDDFTEREIISVVKSAYKQ